MKAVPVDTKASVDWWAELGRDLSGRDAAARQEGLDKLVEEAMAGLANSRGLLIAVAEANAGSQVSTENILAFARAHREHAHLALTIYSLVGPEDDGR